MNQFAKNRTKLDALVKELETSERFNLVSEAHRLTNGFEDLGISHEEASAYILSLREGGVVEIYNFHKSYDSQPICFIVAKEGFPIDMAAKGYAWFPGPQYLLQNVVPTLDGRTRQSGEAFRHIDSEWYLYYTPE